MLKNKARFSIAIACLVGIALASWSMASTLARPDCIALGFSEYEAGNYDKAIEYYTRAIESQPNSAVAYHGRGLAHLKLGSKYTPEGKTSLEKAISDFSKALELKPSYAEAYYHRGLARIEFIHFYDSPFTPAQTELFNEALSDFKKALELDRTFYLAYAGMGNANDRYGEFYKAVEWYNKTLENQDTILKKWGKEALAAIYYSRGRAYQRVENPQVIQDYEAALKYDLRCESALGHLASIYTSAGRYNDALELYNRYVSLKETRAVLGLFDFHAWEGRGECYYKRGKYDEAICDFNKALEVGRRPIIPAYLYLGKTFLAKADESKAREYFNSVIGICTGAIKKVEKGEPVWLYPAEIYALHNLRGLAYLELGDYEQAVSDFEKTTGLSPDFPRGHTFYKVEGVKNAAIAYSRMGDKEKAKRLCEQALREAERCGLYFTKREIEELFKEL